MASSSERLRGPGLASLGLALLCSCSVGQGTGDIQGTLAVDNCREEGAYDLRPSFFVAQAVEDVLEIRVQRGSDLFQFSDGITVLVADAAAVKAEALAQELAVGNDDAQVELTLFLNETCPPDRDKTPVVLSAVGGTVRFESLYAPEAEDDDDVEIEAFLSDVRFVDPRSPDTRWAQLSGFFQFLFVRGKPAQAFP